MSSNTWTHIGACYNGGNNTSYAFVNGVLVGSKVAGGALNLVTSNTAARIGGMVTIGGEYFDGNIQNVRMFNRCLRPTEFMQLYVDPWAGVRTPPSAARYLDSGPAPTFIPRVSFIM